MRLQLSRLVLASAALAIAGVAHADEVTGTWTGDVELRGSYYWEQSTRVIAPAVRLDLEGPSATKIHAGYLVDTITSASQAFGAVVDRRFTELRHDLDIGVTQQIELPNEGDAVAVGLTARTSYEDDYQAYGGGVNGALSFDEEATVLRLSVSFLHDDVSSQIRGGSRVDPITGRDLSDRGEVGELDGVVAGAAWDQVLGPSLTSSLSYDVAYLVGFHANPYRVVPVAGLAQPEHHPEERLRHTVAARLAWFIEDTGTSVHGLLRAYSDDWDIDAITPEVRLYQEIGASTQVRLRYRFYAQTEAFFAPPPGGYPEGSVFVTADPKMTRFRSHLLGVQSILRLDALTDSSLDFLADIELELGIDYIWCTNRYGNAVMAQVAMRIPF